MNHKIEVLSMKKYELPRLYVCRIFELKTGNQVGIRILYREVFLGSLFYDPTTDEIFYNNTSETKVIHNKYYCKVCDTLFNSVSGSALGDIYKKRYLTKKEIIKLNELVSEVYFQIRRSHYESI